MVLRSWASSSAERKDSGRATRDTTQSVRSTQTGRWTDRLAGGPKARQIDTNKARPSMWSLDEGAKAMWNVEYTPQISLDLLSFRISENSVIVRII